MDYIKNWKDIPDIEFFTTEKQDFNEKIECSSQHMECHFRYCTLQERIYFDFELENLYKRKDDTISDYWRRQAVNPCGPFDNAQPIHITCDLICDISPTERSDGIIAQIADYRDNWTLKLEASFVAS